MVWLCTMNDLKERRGLGRGCPGLFGWEAIAQGANTHTNTKDLLDSRSVVYYAFILTFLFRQRRLMPLPISLLQHTLGPAFVQCLVIHTGAVGERERVKARKTPRSGEVGRLRADRAKTSLRPMRRDDKANH
jgi:hypothetical protein